MPKIVISYRRSDTAAITGRMFDELRNLYGEDSVFMDVASNRAGRDFRKEVKKALRQADVMIVVIGAKWLGGAKRGHSKITDAADPVRAELETAFQLDIPVIPVLVDSTEMPKTTDLPRSLKEFPYLHAASINSAKDFHTDMQTLIHEINAFVPDVGTAINLSSRRPIGRAGRKLENDLPSHSSESPEPDDQLRAERTGRTRAPAWHEQAGATGIAALLARAFRKPVIGTHTRYGFPAIATAALLGVGLWQVPPLLKRDTEGGAPVALRPALKPIPTDAKDLRTIAFSPTGKSLAVAGDDGVIRVWDAATFKLLQRLPRLQGGDRGHQDSIRKLAFSTDGSTLVSASFDQTVRIWNVETGDVLGVLGDSLEPSKLYSLAVFPGHPLKWVMAGGYDGKIRVWKVDDQTSQPPLKRVQAHAREVFSLSFAPNDTGDYISGGRDGFMNIYSMPKKEEPVKVKADRETIFHVKHSMSGDTVLSTGSSGKINVWRVNDPSVRKTYEKEKSVYTLTADWSPDGQWLASGGGDRTVLLWRTETQQVLHQFKGHEGDVESVAFHPNGKWLVSASEDRRLTVWDLKERRELFTVVVFDDDEYIQYMPDGRFTGTPGAYRHVKMSSDNGDKELTAEDRKRLFLTPDYFASLISGN